MSPSIESILIPTDDSEGALAGARHGIALASLTGAAVHVLAVVELPEDLADIGDDVAFSPLEAKAEEAVETVATMARDFDEALDVTTVVTRGTPFQSIRAYATRHEIDVIAMGTKGQTGLDRVLLGSVTENVLRTARKPVLVVPPRADPGTIPAAPFERVLLPTDGSDGAEIAAEWGIALATRLDASVDAMYCVDPSPFSGPLKTEAVLDALERRGETAIELVRARAEAADVSLAESIETGPPAERIIDLAADHDADLIVMGTHGRTGIGQWFLGSVTENVVRQADVPVLCVPVSAEAP